MNPQRVTTALAAAVIDLERAESKLHRAFTRWQKARARVRRYDKQLARDFTERADS